MEPVHQYMDITFDNVSQQNDQVNVSADVAAN